MRERTPLPPSIQNAPELGLGLELYYGAFCDLDSCRSFGWGTGPIPWTAVRQWADTYDIYGEQFDDLVYFIRAMDAAYLGYCKAKEKSGNGK